jgi:hypothetical protein
MTTRAALKQAGRRLAARLVELEARLDVGPDEATWRDYTSASAALAAVLEQLGPERDGALLTTAGLAERYNVTPRTLLRWKRRGLVTPALEAGKRGRAALRWKAAEAAR